MGMKRYGRPSKAMQVSLMGLLFALAMALSFFESTLSALMALPPGVKLGLSNIVTMYCLFFLGRGPALTLAVLKSLFVLLTRGAVAAAMSLSGGLCSVLVMLLLLCLPKISVSYLMISVAGAIFHNLGQLAMARWVIGSSKVFYYLPIMVGSGIVMGVVTGMILRVMLPYMNKLNLSLDRDSDRE